MSKYVVESGSSSSSSTSKRPYDAMVYKDADSGYTIAVDGNGNLIQKALSSDLHDDPVIQSGLNIIPTNGGVLRLMGGTYYIQSSLTWATLATKYGQRIIGSGRDTYIVEYGATTPIFNIGSGGTYPIGCELKNVRIVLNGGVGNTDGIKINNCGGLTINGVYISNAGRWGIWAQYNNSLHLIDTIITNCGVGKTWTTPASDVPPGGGLKLGEDEGATHVGFGLLQADRCGFDTNMIGVVSAGSNNAQFNNCTFQSNQYHGLLINHPYYAVNSSYNCQINTGWFEENNTLVAANIYDVSFGRGSKYNSLNNCLYSGSNVTKHIYLHANSAETVINGGFFTGSGDLSYGCAASEVIILSTSGDANSIDVRFKKSSTGATITAGNTYVDVAHGLVATPTKVRITPTTNLGGRSFWVDTKGAANFRINIDSTDSIDHTFDWEAEV